MEDLIPSIPTGALKSLQELSSHKQVRSFNSTLPEKEEVGVKKACGNACKISKTIMHSVVAGVQVASNVGTPGVGSALSGVASLVESALHGGDEATLRNAKKESIGVLGSDCGNQKHEILASSEPVVQCESNSTLSANKNEEDLWATLTKSIKTRMEDLGNSRKGEREKAVISCLAGGALISASVFTVVPVCIVAGVAVGVAVTKSRFTSGGYLRNSDERRTGWQKAKEFKKVFFSSGNRRNREVAVHQALMRKLKIADMSKDNQKGFHPQVIEFNAQSDNEEICQCIADLKKADNERRVSARGKDVQLSSLKVDYQELPDARGSNLFAVNDSEQQDQNSRSQSGWSTIEKILALASTYQGILSDTGSIELNRQFDRDFTSFCDKANDDETKWVIRVLVEVSSVGGAILTSVAMNKSEYHEFRIGLRMVEKMHMIDNRLAVAFRKYDKIVNTSGEKMANKELGAAKTEVREYYGKMSAVLKRKGGACCAAKNVVSNVSVSSRRVATAIKKLPYPKKEEAKKQVLGTVCRQSRVRRGIV